MLQLLVRSVGHTCICDRGWFGMKFAQLVVGPAGSGKVSAGDRGRWKTMHITPRNRDRGQRLDIGTARRRRQCHLLPA